MSEKQRCEQKSEKRQKGGAEKEREKLKRKMKEIDAPQMHNIRDMFSNVKRSRSNADQDTVVVAESDNSNTTNINIDLSGAEDATPSASGRHIEESTTSSTDETTEICMDNSNRVETEKASGSGVLRPTSCEPCKEPEKQHVCSIDDKHTSMFQRPETMNMEMFFKFHPCQPYKNVLFNPNKAYVRSDGVRRMWLSYCEKEEKLFCTVCMAYAKGTGQFITGFNNWNHVYQRIMEHEDTKIHKTSAEAHMMSESGSNIDNKLFAEGISKEKEAVKIRRLLLQRVIDIVKLIGKRGLSYRGVHESANTLDNDLLDHGNFLEILLLLSKYDLVLRNHLDQIIQQSHTRVHDSKGRGRTVTLISKTTVNYVIDALGQLIQETISSDVQAAELFSIQIDTTQDITVTDQCAIVIRYVTDQVHEKLLALVDCHSSTGKAMYERVEEILQSLNIDIKKCVSDSTDGAANMSGQYNGFTTWLEQSSPEHIHVWCYAHVLNLVICDTTENNVNSISLFGLMQKIAVFFRESYKRMDTFVAQLAENTSGVQSLKKLNLIGETRWWSKDAVLRKVFGNFNDQDGCLYREVICALDSIATGSNFNTKTRQEAESLAENLLRYETVLTAQVYLRIFNKTTTLSKYLQTQNLDFVKAFCMVEKTCEEIKTISRDFESVKNATDAFVSNMNDVLESDDVSRVIGDKLPEVRIRRKKKMSGELLVDTPITCPVQKYCVEVHNQVMDQVVNSMESRFKKNQQLFTDISVFDPRGFKKIVDNGVSHGALDKVCSMLQKRFPDNTEITISNLKFELEDFASKWSTLRETTVRAPENEGAYLDVSESDINDNATGHKTGDLCKNCIQCCYYVLMKYNLFSKAYSTLFLAYKLLLTISVTQVSCERAFSKLKYIKNRLRSLLTQDHLQSLMLMAIEKQILVNIDADVVIDIIASKSKELSRLLK
jgi:hypothetical protein